MVELGDEQKNMFVVTNLIIKVCGTEWAGFDIHGILVALTNKLRFPVQISLTPKQNHNVLLIISEV